MTFLNYIIYITLCILLQFLVEIESQAAISRPDSRDAHTATFINDKLYILGGVIPPFGSKEPSKETFFYLDCTAPFDTNGLKWIDLSNNNIVPPHFFAAAAKGGASNNTLFIYGGENLGSDPMSPVYTFETTNNKWNVPIITGVPPSGKVDMISIIDYNGSMYLYGGITSEYNSSTYTNDMFILDTINLSWKRINSTDAPNPRVGYGTVLISDRNILYMGM